MKSYFRFLSRNKLYAMIEAFKDNEVLEIK
jgi:hypothetical protein